MVGRSRGGGGSRDSDEPPIFGPTEIADGHVSIILYDVCFFWFHKQ